MPRRRHHRRSRHHHHRHRRYCHRRRRASSFFATERERGRADPLSGVMTMLCKVVSLEERYLHEIFLCSNDSESAFSIVHDVSYHTSPPPAPAPAGPRRREWKEAQSKTAQLTQARSQELPARILPMCVSPGGGKNYHHFSRKRQHDGMVAGSDCVLLLTIGDKEAASCSVGTTLLS